MRCCKSTKVEDVIDLPKPKRKTANIMEIVQNQLDTLFKTEPKSEKQLFSYKLMRVGIQIVVLQIKLTHRLEDCMEILGFQEHWHTPPKFDLTHEPPFEGWDELWHRLPDLTDGRSVIASYFWLMTFCINEAQFTEEVNLEELCDFLESLGTENMTIWKKAIKFILNLDKNMEFWRQTIYFKTITLVPEDKLSEEENKKRRIEYLRKYPDHYHPRNKFKFLSVLTRTEGFIGRAAFASLSNREHLKTLESLGMKITESDEKVIYHLNECIKMVIEDPKQKRNSGESGHVSLKDSQGKGTSAHSNQVRQGQGQGQGQNKSHGQGQQGHQSPPDKNKKGQAQGAGHKSPPSDSESKKTKSQKNDNKNRRKSSGSNRRDTKKFKKQPKITEKELKRKWSNELKKEKLSKSSSVMTTVSQSLSSSRRLSKIQAIVRQRLEMERMSKVIKDIKKTLIGEEKMITKIPEGLAKMKDYLYKIKGLSSTGIPLKKETKSKGNINSSTSSTKNPQIQKIDMMYKKMTKEIIFLIDENFEWIEYIGYQLRRIIFEQRHNFHICYSYIRDVYVWNIPPYDIWSHHHDDLIHLQNERMNKKKKKKGKSDLKKADGRIGSGRTDDTSKLSPVVSPGSPVGSHSPNKSKSKKSKSAGVSISTKGHRSTIEIDAEEEDMKIKQITLQFQNSVYQDILKVLPAKAGKTFVYALEKDDTFDTKSRRDLRAEPNYDLEASADKDCQMFVLGFDKEEIEHPNKAKKSKPRKMTHPSKLV